MWRKCMASEIKVQQEKFVNINRKKDMKNSNAEWSFFQSMTQFQKNTGKPIGFPLTLNEFWRP